MKHLIEKLEQASEGTQHVVLYDALEYAHEQGWLTATQQDFALQLLHGGAFIEAAMMLVPEGWVNIQIFISKKGCKARLRHKEKWRLVAPMEDGEGPDKLVATPALALCIAACKAREV